MENSDHATEGDPLKREDGVEAGTTTSATELKKKCCKEGFAKLTHWRTAVFFFSLFLCLTVVFAFSFIIPCPVRPQYLISWNRSFNEAGEKVSVYCHYFYFSQISKNGLNWTPFCFTVATYDFLAIEDTSKDKVLDVLFVLKAAEGSQNNTCVGAGII